VHIHHKAIRIELDEKIFVTYRFVSPHRNTGITWVTHRKLIESHGKYMDSMGDMWVNHENYC